MCVRGGLLRENAAKGFEINRSCLSNLTTSLLPSLLGFLPSSLPP